VADNERVETESMPLTEPYKPTFDTGIHQKVEPELIEPELPPRRRRWWHRRSDAAKTPDGPAGGLTPAAYADAPPSGSMPTSSIADHCVRWWQFVLILWAVWIPAGAIGAGLFYWWSHDASKHKTTVVFVVLAYVVVSAVAGLILAVVADRPLISALAIAMISAVFAAVVGAAPVYGKFYCDHTQRHCAAGVLPY
jgi:heme A synthase